ncbi:MAG TPA: glycoside hydrolase family 19 protein [Vicinamibacterales bacterium]|nr:glycoside hydrolase family 19 protein [Vicinamibacterales bacterium]
MLTTEQLKVIMPLLPAAKRATLFPFLTAAVNEFGIDQPARTAAFLAQLAHESAQFRFMEEIWGPTAAQRRYEPPGKLAGDLGNTDAGDGRRFKGRGPIQITGRANYRRFGDLLGLDLVSAPEQAALPDVAFRIAGLYWSKKGLNELADRVTAEAFREITRRINGGFNGLAERERFYETAKAVLNVVGPGGVSFDIEEELDTVEPVFERGLEGMRVEAAAAPPRRKTAKRKGPKRVATKAVRKKTASKRSAKRVAKKRAVKKAVRKGPARKGARKRAAKRR